MADNGIRVSSDLEWDKQVDHLLSERLLPEPDPEDPARCELHRYVLARIRRFTCPDDSEAWLAEASQLRRRFLERVYLKGHPETLLKLKPEVRWKGVIETCHGYRIRKLLYEGYPGMWIPALLYEPTFSEGKIPGVLNPNGHHAGGKAMDYKQARCINLAKRGMLALSTEFIGMGELTMNVPHNRISYMDLCGKAGVAIFYMAMKRALDVLLSHPNCDPERVAMTGLSGGGWQTAVLSALDERIRVVVPVAGHSPVWQRPSCRSDIGDLEQTPTDLCTVADFDTLTALFAPRPSLLIYNRNDDCCFKSDRTRVSIYEPVRPLYSLLGVPDNIQFYDNTNPGTHNYESDNRSQLYRFLNEHFRMDTPWNDLPYRDELLSESQLEVGIPEDNATIPSLAERASRELPRLKVPGDAAELPGWIEKARKTLADIIHLHAFNVRYESAGDDGVGRQHRLYMDDIWTVAVTEIAPRQEAGKITSDDALSIVLSDGGRPSTAGIVKAEARRGRAAMAADVFGTGERRYPSQYQMVLAATGERPLGILAGQILAIEEWAASLRSASRVRLHAMGLVTSFACLCAAALRPDRLSHLYLDGLHDSLKRLIQLPVEYDSAVPLLCFGLLEELDVPQLLAMTENVPVERPGRGPIKPIALSPHSRDQ